MIYIPHSKVIGSDLVFLHIFVSYFYAIQFIIDTIFTYMPYLQVHMYYTHIWKSIAVLFQNKIRF